MPRTRAVSALIALASAMLLASGCSFGGAGTSGRELRIGVELPLTGPEAGAARPALNGIRFYVDGHPKLGAFNVSLSVGDDARGGPASPSFGEENLRRFVADRGVVAVIGPLDGAVARQEIPIANAGGLALLSPATSGSCLTRDDYLPAGLNPARTAISCTQAGVPAASALRPANGNTFFRLATTDDLQGAAAADFAYKNLHILRAGVISDGESYGQGLAAAFAARFARLGGAVVGRSDVDPANVDARSFLQRAKAEHAGAIYYGGGASGCAIRAQMAAVFAPGEQTPFLGGDAIAEDPDCVTAAGINTAGVYATAPIVDALTASAAASTVGGFKTVFSAASDLGPYTLLAYDAAAVLYAAIERALSAAGGGMPSRGSIDSELAKTSGFVGATGTIGFDAAGDTTNRVVSVYEPAGSYPNTPWRLAGSVDYSARLPY